MDFWIVLGIIILLFLNLLIAYVAATFVAMVFKWPDFVRWIFVLVFFFLPFVGWLAVVITLFVIVFVHNGKNKGGENGKNKGGENNKNAQGVDKPFRKQR